MSSRFEQNSPAIGDPMPVVSVHDEGGQTFVTDRFKGQFTVLVFGCLT
jgi:peroxiredoxin